MSASTRSRFATGLAAAVCVAILPVLTACRPGHGSDRPETVPVRGLLTLDGKPVEDALVTFQRVDGSRSSVGRTDRSGRYMLTTFVPGDGAEPGEYRVAIVKYGPFDPANAPPETYELRQSGRTPGESRPENLLPSAYATSTTSGLKASVQKGGRNDFSFELSSGVPAPPRARPEG